MKAVYLLFLGLDAPGKIKIGALGEKSFEEGIYVYVGSAMNGVEKRLERHFGDDKKLHWHIDYFSREAKPFDYFILPESSEYECVMSGILEKFCEPVESFGSSDCGCESHLYRISEDFSR